MATKTISLAEDAYAALLAAKRPDESFSDAVRRLARRRSLTELSGIMGARDADALAANIQETRKKRLSIRKQEIGAHDS